jgi:3-oxoacyl-[acyl-carrier-protein] synthase-3
MYAKIIGTGSYVPDEVVTNKELEQHLPTSAQWIEERLGIQERRIIDRDQETSDMATLASREALKDAGVSPKDIDLIIVATVTPDMVAPSTATIVQDKLQAYQASAFDVNAVCTGFVYAFTIGTQFIETGMYERVLVIGADAFSRVTDWNDRSAVFFGDGAGAVVLEKSDKRGVIKTHLYADGRGKDGFTIYDGHTFDMDNKLTFDTASAVLPWAVTSVLEDAGLSPDDVDLVIPHQPSIHILRNMAEVAGIPFEKVMTSMDKYANTAAGSVPIMLDNTNKLGLLKSGDIVVLTAVGAGWTWGASVLRW